MLKTVTFRKAKDVKKGWGKEVQIVNNVIPKMGDFQPGYSGKLLIYDKIGATSSFHFHTIKKESFFLLTGEALFRFYDPENADVIERKLEEGDIVEIPPNNPHQIVALTKNVVIIEFASTDYNWDNFRIGKGDSQNNG